ncbi:allatostatin C [Acyrthosiphon pisum]|uniref:Prohormone-1 n=1 Tax=Acyrthosiphon pisum TaxID=7029 RepID=A0A8R2AAG3_ACYPI|nr:allatostatin C [Acyrthosiphon pisum]|eukprot:XP_003244026.1 PREDICTED: allatostatin C [Acyrthosiphon pisum]
MATQMGFLSYGIILTLTVLTVLLPLLTTGNVIDQRVLQRELGENSPEIMSMSDKDVFRDIEEPAIDDFTIKTKSEDQNLEIALIDYLFAKQMMNRIRARTDSFRAQKKRSYWKQCAFNAVSCFG